MDWVQAHLGALVAVGGSMLVGTVAMVAALFVVVQLPADYLRKKQKGGERQKAGWKRIGKNILGWGLITAGVAMVVLPGPGVVVAIIGVAMADFPGKARLLRWLLSRGRIMGAMNRLRARFSKPPLEVGPAT